MNREHFRYLWYDAKNHQLFVVFVLTSSGLIRQKSLNWQAYSARLWDKWNKNVSLNLPSTVKTSIAFSISLLFSVDLRHIKSEAIVKSTFVNFTFKKVSFSKFSETTYLFSLFFSCLAKNLIKFIKIIWKKIFLKCYINLYLML